MKKWLLYILIGVVLGVTVTFLSLKYSFISWNLEIKILEVVNVILSAVTVYIGYYIATVIQKKLTNSNRRFAYEESQMNEYCTLVGEFMLKCKKQPIPLEEALPEFKILFSNIEKIEIMCPFIDKEPLKAAKEGIKNLEHIVVENIDAKEAFNYRDVKVDADNYFSSVFKDLHRAIGRL